MSHGKSVRSFADGQEMGSDFLQRRNGCVPKPSRNGLAHTNPRIIGILFVTCVIIRGSGARKGFVEKIVPGVAFKINSAKPKGWDFVFVALLDR